MTEQELIWAAQRGDDVAFEELVRQYEKRVYHLALRMCGSEEDAWDVAQDAFLAAWRALPGFRGEAGFATWLYRLTHNAAIDHLRKNKKQRFDMSLDDEELDLAAADRGPGPQQVRRAGSCSRRWRRGWSSSARITAGCWCCGRCSS